MSHLAVWYECLCCGGAAGVVGHYATDEAAAAALADFAPPEDQCTGQWSAWVIPVPEVQS